MIKNERQYKITRSQARKLKSTIERAKDLQPSRRRSRELQGLHLQALKSQLSVLKAEIEEYEVLKKSRWKPVVVKSIEGVPKALIKSRISAGLTQKQLAEQLGMKEQQLQRYEATDYDSVSWAKIRKIAEALRVRIACELPKTLVSPKAILERLSEAGLSKKFLTERLLPMWISEKVFARGANKKKEDVTPWTLHAAGILSRVFGWKPAAILGGARLSPEDAAFVGARFKSGTSTDEIRVSAYTVYVHYLASLVLEATPSLSSKSIPVDPEIVRSQILSSYGDINLVSILKYAWSLGIPVLPLHDPGAFHGACWRMDGRNLIVLKQRTPFQARWQFDLLHEIRHLAQEPNLSDMYVLEPGEMDLDEITSEEEDASQFAGDVLLNERAEELAHICVKEAQGRLEYLKKAISRVATREGVPIGCLAYYMAFRLSLQGENWWGTATNLQEKKGNPCEVARDMLLQKADIGLLNEIDSRILMQALTNAKEAVT